MKYLAVILFFSLLLFNLVGYRLWCFYAQSQSDKQMEATVSNNAYDSASLIMIKMPLKVPYLNDWPDFEPVVGEIERDGQVYRCVKEKVQGDSLIIMVLPDHDKTRLQAANNEFFKKVNDLDDTRAPKKNNASGPKMISLEYDHPIFEWTQLYAVVSSVTRSLVYTSCLSTGFRGIPEQPPTGYRYI